MERPLRLWSWRLVRAGVRSDPRRTPDEMRRRWTCSESSVNGQSRRCGGRRNKGRNTTCTLEHHNLAVTIIVWNYLVVVPPLCTIDAVDATRNGLTDLKRKTSSVETSRNLALSIDLVHCCWSLSHNQSTNLSFPCVLSSKRSIYHSKRYIDGILIGILKARAPLSSTKSHRTDGRVTIVRAVTPLFVQKPDFACGVWAPRALKTMCTLAELKGHLKTPSRR